MFCSKCGSPNAPAASFCTRCGKPISNTGVPGQPAMNAPPTAELMARPGVITLLAALDLFFGVIWLLVAGAIAYSLANRKPDAADLAFLVIMGVLGLLAVVAGIGLLQMKEYGRIVQFGISTIGLLAIPIGTIISALILYYLTRPGVRVLFSGKRAEQLTPEETGAVLQLKSVGGVGVVVAVVVGSLVFIAFLGIVAAIAIPNLLTAMQRSKQKRTMADMRTIATAWEARATDINTYSPSPSTDPGESPAIADERGVLLDPSARVKPDDLAKVLAPTYLRELPRLDGWEHEVEFYVGSGGLEYVIRSLGKNGTAESNAYEAGGTTNFDCDIVYANGAFVAYPGGPSPRAATTR